MRSLLVLVALLVWTAPPAEAEIYTWVDEAGVSHFSDRLEDVPAGRRRPLDLARGESAERVPSAPEGLRAADRRVEDVEPANLPVELQNLVPSAPPAGRAALPAALGAFSAGVIALVALGSVLLGVALGAVLLKLACRLCGEESPGFGRACGIVLVQGLAGLAVGVATVLVLGLGDTAEPGGMLRAQAASGALSFAASAAVLRGMWLDTLGRSLAVVAVVYLVTLGIGLVLGLGAALLLAGALPRAA
jgi:Domain of unknown function (DUF4124)